ncbi:MAG: response regulator [Betaproteobacteria bacterium]|nr:response regulator [Betaproteobacteria bacterium]NDF05742.1 response regulator [Betaproteobacteria bacterium]
MHALAGLFARHWPDDLLSQRHFVLRSYICFAMLIIGGFCFVSGPFEHVPLSLLSMAALSLIGVLYIWRNWPVAVVTHALLTVCFSLIYIVCMNTGGLASPQILWLGILPLPSLVLLGFKETFIWVAVVMSAIGSLFALTFFGYLPSDFAFKEQHLNWATISLMCVAANVFWVPVFYYVLNKQQLVSLKERNFEFEGSRQALLKSEAYKDEFVAAVGHELRTPMNAILGFNDVLLENMHLTPQELETVRLIRQSTDKLLKLVNQILDFSQLQAGRLVLNPTPVKVSDALAQCRATFLPAPDSPVSLVTELDPSIPDWVSLDAVRVKEVLCHLLDNAFKFTTHGEVRLRLSHLENELLFEVIDSGSGIPKELQEYIFKRFEHADQATVRQFGGTGLGLAISKKLVALFGGSIGLESTLGEGSRFWFTVPLVACAAPASHALSTHAPDLSNYAMRILMVDDNPVNLQVARYICQSIWPLANIVDTASGLQALELLKQSAFDVVLMDMFMPGMNGPQTCQAIRHQLVDPICHIPVIGLTASTHAQDRQLCLEAGMNEVLPKPMDKVSLAATVNSLVHAAMSSRTAHAV